MNVLILGSGGREHALSWKIAQSPLLENIYIAPGNAGTQDIGQNVPLDILDFDEIADFALSEEIDIIVVGPEAPLVAGIYDYFQDREDTKNIKVVGPSLEGSKLEGSKSYGKVFMMENDIPTAAYGEFTSETLDEGIAHLRAHSAPYVLKADGLAAGKGVLIIDNLEEAESELKEMLSGKFGDASSTVVIEEFLDGIEFSVFVLTDGTRYKVLPIAKDYKRIGEGDTGLNTGGMGAVSPVPFVDEAMMQKVEERIIKPTISGIQKREIAYTGFVFIGLISVGGEPKVIEYNCRMGDPETEVVDLFKISMEDYSEKLTDIDRGNIKVAFLIPFDYYEEPMEIDSSDRKLLKELEKQAEEKKKLVKSPKFLELVGCKQVKG